MRSARLSLVIVAVFGVFLIAARSTRAAPLRDSATAKGLFVGAAVNMTPFRNEPIYSDTLKREFNMLVGENAFKFDAVHPAQTTFNFTDTDALVAFAEANGMAIRGHTLVWHNQIPGWLTGGNFTRDQVIAIMRDHIMTLVGRYRGRIAAWDVVNEAIDDGTGQLRTSSFWFQKIGPEYVAMAFQFAHEADPDAVLYYNDFEAEAGGTKSDGVFNLVSGLVSQGVPIGGVGWQMHKVNPFRISTANHTNAQRLANLGLEISITEMDVRIQLPSDAQELQAQALAYSDAVTFCLTEPNCAAVVSWGFTDKFSWVPGTFSGFGDALMFDMSYQPKPAYTAMQSVLEAGQTQPNFSLSATPSSVSVNSGACQTSTIGVTRTGGFTAGVALTATGLPSGVTASFNPATATGASSVVTVCASATAALGSTTLTVSGTGGGLTRTTPLGLTVTTTTGTGGVTVTPVIAASGPWFNEEQVRITNTANLTALSVTIVLQRTGGISFSGQYNTVGGQIA
ncbi:MAG TPA: endo-1,4-beta-xylanase, partial [Kofleriaceae bacterium]|nr:endo-1,4-beta-xylanase [Kofleriaceae bacterium]